MRTNKTGGGTKLDEEFGFIRGKLDLKILILYVLARLPGPVGRDDLADVVFCDGGVDYFTYSDCLSELESTGHIHELDGKYVITESGRTDGAIMETSLPASVRAQADMAMLPLAAKISRDALIQTGHEKTKQGCIVELAVEDGQGEILSMRLLAANERQARRMEDNFRNMAEELYVRIVDTLSKE